jgi:transcriptional regulator with XRE-family HTH domain
MPQDPHPIETFRRARGLRQADLGALVGVSDNTIAAWERGARPQPQRVPRLAEALGVDPLELTRQLTQWTATNQPGLFDVRPRRRRRVDVPPAGAGA